MGGFLDKLEVHLPPTSGRPRASPLRVRCVLPLTFFPSGEGWIATALVARRGGLCEAHGGRSFLMALPPTATPPPPSRGRQRAGAAVVVLQGRALPVRKHPSLTSFVPPSPQKRAWVRCALDLSPLLGRGWIGSVFLPRRVFWYVSFVSHLPRQSQEQRLPPLPKEGD